jgi:hypothetical protein
MSTDIDKTKTALQNLRDSATILPKLSASMNGLGLDFADLEKECQSTMVDAHLLGTDLESLFAVWDTLQPGLPDQVAELILRRLLISIMAATQDVSSFRATATSLQVTTEAAIGQLNTAIAATKQRIQDEQDQLTQLATDMQNIQNRMAQLQQEMSGSTGFWQAVGEALSGGAYHPIEDNLNEQRDLYRQAVDKRQSVINDLAAIQANTDLLSRASQSLALAEGLDDSTATLENVVLRISGLAAKTEHDDTQATEATNGKVAAFFRNRFNSDMTELATWRGVFQ